MSDDPLRVVIADDNPVVRAGLTALLSAHPDFLVAGQAADGREAHEEARRHRPDVILLDVRMPRVDGLTALPHLVPLAPVLMTTYSGETGIVHEALRLGASGYLVHGEFTAEQLLAAVRDATVGRAHLTPTASTALLTAVRAAPACPSSCASATNPTPTPGELPSTAYHFPQTPSQAQAVVAHSLLSQREVEVMELIASGMTNQQIATTCFISQKTVKNHINRIFAKLNADNRGQAIAFWHALGKAAAHG
ncbi:response regulator transcription factor [Streptomyces sp. NPDC047097]|uniref:response regulator transcription factor n=1 Tax=Streptomyces sp. NPDC047097 TaxID=3155260 RepID=UPI0033DFAD75